ncbi:NAD-dependent protein deacetylase sirtuin-3, mitochondrial-like isoform X3 [Pleurodeles waltl]|uniref:NAD-dependent protein deacetylase sirtuin-3, mitochondrial-like isoform X3 n=1 Tax=Pleurodeles waltl TaxID=8319 RepID=UPI0037097B66
MSTTRSRVWTTRQNLSTKRTPSAPTPSMKSTTTTLTLGSGCENSAERSTFPRASSLTTNGHKDHDKSITESNEESTLVLTKSISQLKVGDQQSRILRKSSSAKGSSATPTKNSAKSKRPTSRSRCTNLTDIADLILHGTCKKIIVMVGAGISTASGIPDFRTPGTGLYDNLVRYNIPYPEAIFDINYFTHNPRPFFALAKELYPGKYKPNFVHYFVRMLHEKGCLLRLYTQNIDGLERMAGIPSEKLVEAHGSFLTASCHLCYTPFPAKEAQESIVNGHIPRCKFCHGVVKPDIVFFGEDLPKRFYELSKDFGNADLLIIMGTSLEINISTQLPTGFGKAKASAPSPLPVVSKPNSKARAAGHVHAAKPASRKPSTGKDPQRTPVPTAVAHVKAPGSAFAAQTSSSDYESSESSENSV